MTVCRYHGAKKPKAIRRGKDHWNYQHGQETLEAKAERSKRLAKLHELEALSYAYGLVPAGTPRWRGRKPKLGGRCLSIRDQAGLRLGEANEQS